MNKVVQRHVSEPSTANDSFNERWRYYSDSDDSPQETSSSRDYVSEPCLLAASLEERLSFSHFPNAPWSRSESYSPTIEGLHTELIECFEWLRPSEAEKFARTCVFHRIQDVFLNYSSQCYCSVFGSVATNLFLPTSDIDITATLPVLNPEELGFAADLLRNDSSFTDIIVLDRIHVPIIKLVDCRTGFNVDISFNSHRGHSAVQYIMHMTCQFPALELLALLLKQFLAARHLNQAYTGGLSSYGLLLMIIHFMLRNYSQHFFGKTVAQLEVGILGEFLMQFLRYYGQDFDPMTDGLGFENPVGAVLLPKATLTAYMREEICASIFCIQDPINPANDVGRGAHNFMQVRAAFSSAFAELDSLMKGEKRQSDSGPMLQNVIFFAESLIEFRKKIDGLPFDVIKSHPGNATGIVGGQPLYGHFGPYIPQAYASPVPVNGHLMKPSRAIYGEQYPVQPLVLEENSDPQNSDNCTSPSSSGGRSPYYVIPPPPYFPNPMFGYLPPHMLSALPMMLDYQQQQPPPYYPMTESGPDEDEYYNESSSSEECPIPIERKKSTSKLMSSNSSTSSSGTGCSTVTPDCDSSDSKRLTSSSSDSVLSD